MSSSSNKMNKLGKAKATCECDRPGSPSLVLAGWERGMTDQQTDGGLTASRMEAFCHSTYRVAYRAACGVVLCFEIDATILR